LPEEEVASVPSSTEDTVVIEQGKSPPSKTSRSSQDSKDIFEIFVLVISLIAIASVCSFLGREYLRNRSRNRSDNTTNQLRWATQGYRDHETPEINIAPRRSFAESPIASRQHFSSSTDPMVYAGAHPDVEDAMSSFSPTNEELASPQVYIGPPRDEDGHELHNVEIF
jgi:hypothetical protein